MIGPRRVAAAVGLALAMVWGPVPASAAPYLDEVYSQVSVREDLVYGAAPDASGNQVQLLLDLYEPVGDASERRPVIIWVHGGGFGVGSRNNPKIIDLATTFAKRGYVTASIEYRLLADPPCSHQDAGSPNCVNAALAAKDDAQAAVRWFRANRRELRIDPSRIAMGGFSAGSVTSLLVGTWPENPGSSGNPGESSEIQAVVSNCGYLPENSLITPDDAPTVFFHGTNDQIAPIEGAQATHAALLAAGVPSEFTAFQGGHCPSWDVYREPTLAGAVPFVYTHLRLPMKRRCDVLLEGGDGDDRLKGTEFGDLIRARAGQDRLNGRAAGDCLRAGGGDDRITADDGDEDEVRCGPGKDLVHADRRDELRGCERVKS